MENEEIWEKIKWPVKLVAHKQPRNVGQSGKVATFDQGTQTKTRSRLVQIPLSVVCNRVRWNFSARIRIVSVNALFVHGLLRMDDFECMSLQ